MRDCEQFEALLHAQLDEMITEEEQRRLLEHLAGCEHCRTLQQDLLELSDAMSDMHVAPPADLAANIMAAVQQEQRRAVIPMRRKRIRAIVGSLAACLAVVVVTAAALRGTTGLKSNDNTSMEAAPFNEQGSEVETADVDQAPQDAESIEEADGTEQSEENETIYEPVEEQPEIPELNGLGPVEGVPDTNETENAAPPVKSAPRSIPAQEQESVAPSDDEILDGTTVQTENSDASTAEMPPITSYSAEAENNDALVSETPDSTIADVTTSISYAKELYFTAVDSVPDFLLELGVPDISGGASSYELIVSIEEYNAIELQFIANGLDYAVAVHHEENTDNTLGRIVVTYERTQRESASATDDDAVLPLP